MTRSYFIDKSMIEDEEWRNHIELLENIYKKLGEQINNSMDQYLNSYERQNFNFNIFPKFIYYFA